MKTISYVIDPDGDIEIVHREPNSHQAIPKIHSDDCSTHTDLPDSDFDNPPATGRYTFFNELYTKSTTVTEVLRTPFLDLLLASSNKDASSPHCSACSSPPSPPSQPFTRIHTIGWGAVALAIVLDAIHGRHSEIPRVINLGLLARIATVVDYYKCQEAIHILFGYWQRNIIR
ncbi:hypothetical protein DER44DRAFT_818863 [Fusarium oxysporum]|nr:hypothetical protein DER44DRAFT_818863 [Fusarium oxysporum]